VIAASTAVLFLLIVCGPTVYQSFREARRRNDVMEHNRQILRALEEYNAKHPNPVRELPTDAPLQVLTGNDSAVRAQGVRRLRTGGDWRATWAEHRTNTGDSSDPKLEIDFNIQEVVAIFGGASTNTSGYRVETEQASQDEIEIRVNPDRYQTSGVQGDVDSATPFVFIVLPKSGSGLVVLENTQTYLDMPPEWTPLATLPVTETSE
jgi:hypothetical protein